MKDKFDKEYMRNYYVVNRDKLRKHKKEFYLLNKNRILRTKRSKIMEGYGSSIEIYDQLVTEQDNKCAICKKRNIGGRCPGELIIDHCHVTNKFRGLLCSKCNLLLGNGYDRIEVLLEAINYLKKFNGKK